MLSRYFAVEEFVARKRRVLAEMEKRGCATAVIFGRGAGTHEHHGDLLYLTNYYSSASGQEPAATTGEQQRQRQQRGHDQEETLTRYSDAF